MSFKTTSALLIAVMVSGASQAFARPVQNEWERALIDNAPRYAGPSHYPSPSAPLKPNASTSHSGHGPEVIMVEMQAPNPWTNASGPCCCTTNGDAASARIDRLLAKYGEAPMNEFSVGREWSKEAVGCASQLLEEKRLGEAVRFCKREIQRAQAYKNEPTLGQAASYINAQLKRLLMEANLFGCD